MVEFKTMWNDVCGILSNDEVKNIQIVEKFTSGFVVEDENDTHFITKDDFVDFWCNMIYFQEVAKEKISLQGKSKLKYVYEVIKNLPYINEKEGILRLAE